MGELGLPSPAPHPGGNAGLPSPLPLGSGLCLTRQQTSPIPLTNFPGTLTDEAFIVSCHYLFISPATLLTGHLIFFVKCH